MPTLVEDIIIQQGATYQHVYAVTDAPGSIAGYTARMQVRSSKSSDVILATGIAVVDGINNQVVVTIDEPDTRVMTWSRGLYDVELVDPTPTPPKVWRIAQGAARLSKEVTR